MYDFTEKKGNGMKNLDVLMIEGTIELCSSKQRESDKGRATRKTLY